MHSPTNQGVNDPSLPSSDHPHQVPMSVKPLALIPMQHWVDRRVNDPSPTLKTMRLALPGGNHHHRIPHPSVLTRNEATQRVNDPLPPSSSQKCQPLVCSYPPASDSMCDRKIQGVDDPTSLLVNPQCLYDLSLSLSNPICHVPTYTTSISCLNRADALDTGSDMMSRHTTVCSELADHAKNFPNISEEIYQPIWAKYGVVKTKRRKQFVNHAEEVVQHYLRVVNRQGSFSKYEEMLYATVEGMSHRYTEAKKAKNVQTFALVLTFD